jgi:hypothetical protein
MGANADYGSCWPCHVGEKIVARRVVWRSAAGVFLERVAPGILHDQHLRALAVGVHRQRIIVGLHLDAHGRLCVPRRRAIGPHPAAVHDLGPEPPGRVLRPIAGEGHPVGKLAGRRQPIHFVRSGGNGRAHRRGRQRLCHRDERCVVAPYSRGRAQRGRRTMVAASGNRRSKSLRSSSKRRQSSRVSMSAPLHHTLCTAQQSRAAGDRLPRTSARHKPLNAAMLV